MKNIILLLIVSLISGCIGGKKVSREQVSRVAVPDVVESFEVVDVDGNGTIDREEYYSSSVSINTDQPTTGLMWIVGSVIVCTFGAAFLYRKKLNCGCKR
ncbi:MAG: hypothetical protein CL885_04815 [Dehalococcoidia bacterium]|nr:hypothetical protein [Dehalococcoidia bacterium]|tara:strand:+ start:143 stop:442 length:300 start_codon:yes stop_codon:yes gene_type:complete